MFYNCKFILFIISIEDDAVLSQATEDRPIGLLVGGVIAVIGLVLLVLLCVDDADTAGMFSYINYNSCLFTVLCCIKCRSKK